MSLSWEDEEEEKNVLSSSGILLTPIQSMQQLWNSKKYQQNQQHQP